MPNSPPIRSNAFNRLGWYPRHRSDALRTRSARPGAPLPPSLMTFFTLHPQYFVRLSESVLFLTSLFPGTEDRALSPHMRRTSYLFDRSHLRICSIGHRRISKVRNLNMGPAPGCEGWAPNFRSFALSRYNTDFGFRKYPFEPVM